MFSIVPSSSRWTGAIAVITPTSGRAISRERADLPEPAHAHLGDDDVGVGLEAAERERQADLVVEARPPLRRARTCGRRARRGCPSSRSSRTEPVIATTRASLRARTARPSAASAANSSRGTSVAAAPRARASSRNATPPPTRDEEVAGRDAARVDLHPCDGRPRRLEPAEAAQLLQRQRDHVRAPSAQRLARRLAVVERNRLVGELLPLLGALAGDQHDVAVARRLDRARDRGRAVELDLHVAVAPATISSMIACGSSLRGLSDVTIATSASSDAIRPISGRFSRSRSPPQPKTQITRPVASSRAACSSVLERVRLVRVVDDHRRTAAPRRPPRTARDAAHRLEARARSRRRRCRAAARPRARRARSRR